MKYTVRHSQINNFDWSASIELKEMANGGKEKRTESNHMYLRVRIYCGRKIQ